MSFSFWGKLSKNNSYSKRFYQIITRVMHEFKLSPFDVYGGEMKITGRIGEMPVDLKLTYEGMDSLAFDDLLKFVAESDKAHKKANKRK